MRSYAQRNNNVTKLVPTYEGILPETDISGAPIYEITISNAQFTNGVFYVDLSDVDSSGNLIDLSGLFFPFVPDGDTLQPIPIVTFTFNIETNASVYPGQEITVFFRNIPYERLDGIPLLTIGIVGPLVGMGPPFPYILSPPFPPAIVRTSPSITFKSDGDSFNIVSSGPAGWLGLPALSIILAAYGNIGP